MTSVPACLGSNCERDHALTADLRLDGPRELLPEGLRLHEQAVVAVRALGPP